MSQAIARVWSPPRVVERSPAPVFGSYAPLLLQVGYSPVPIAARTKQPLIRDWGRLRIGSLTQDEIEAISTLHADAGIGVVGGFSGLVPIDIDTDDEEIVAAITTALRPPVVGKRGRRGITHFYRSAVPIPATKLLGGDGTPIVEILTTGQTVIPPTLHPETGQPYRWSDADFTLFTVSADELPDISIDDIGAVKTALAPWLQPQREYVSRPTVANERISPTRMRAYAEAALAREADRLRRMGKDSGRNRALFDAGCKLGRFVHHGVLTKAELERALLHACNANSLIAEDGQPACERSLESGVRKAEGDDLPILEYQPHIHGRIMQITRTDRTGTRDASDAADDEPLPLTRPLPQSDPFPLEALGPLREPVLAIQAATQAPMALCANAIISTAALAGQAHVDVVLPTRQTKPISVNMLTIALSGERKTTVDGFAVRSVELRQSQLRDLYREEIITYVAERKAWEAQTRKIGNDKHLGYREQADRIAALGPEPRAPLCPLLIIDEPTAEGLIKLLQEGQPSIGIFTSEGGAFIGGHGFSDDAKLRTAATLSMLWDDGSSSRVRAGDGACTVEGKRVSMHLQAQPDVGARFFADRVLMDQGLVWRFLVAAPDSTQGQRFWRETDAGHNSALDNYYQRVTALLNAPPPLRPGARNELAPRPLMLSAEARAFWVTASDEIERRVGPDGDLRPISGYANKLLEHATRLAGILTIYEDIDAREINEETMKRGFELATYYAQTALRLRNAAYVNVELCEAEELLRWLHDRWCPLEGPLISVPELVHYGPNGIRVTNKARHLISILEKHHHLRRLDGRHKVKGKMRREVWEVRK